MIKTSRQLKDKIRNLAAAKSANAQLLMRTFMTERFLERISVSAYHNRLILKGGTLVTAMVGIEARSTMDVDFTVRGVHFDEYEILAMLTSIASLSVNDNVVFRVLGVSGIMGDAEYPGFRVSMEALFDGTVIPVKIDCSTGDAIIPGAIRFPYRLMFEDRSIPVLSYNLETVLAEKLETIVSRGVLNTRMRDYYDVYVLLQTYRESISLDDFKAAFAATVKQRGSENLMAHAGEILRDCALSDALQQLWKAYASSFSYAASLHWNQVMGAVSELAEGAV